MSTSPSSTSQSRSVEAQHALRGLITDGTLAPGTRLREAELSEQLGVSRNTLREAFRVLEGEGLVTVAPNRGARVSTPTITSIIDVFRVRRVIESQALREAIPRHPGVARMRSATEHAIAARDAGDWLAVGTGNIEFHTGIMSLTDSPRLARLYEQLSAELRLAFGLVDDPEYLHAPFIDRNVEILELVDSGDSAGAAERLSDYLHLSERMLLAAYQRVIEGNSPA